MNITNERLRNLRDLERDASPDEQQALAQFALDVRVLADKKRWRREEAMFEDDYSRAYKQGQLDCADDLDELSRSE